MLVLVVKFEAGLQPYDSPMWCYFLGAFKVYDQFAETPILTPRELRVISLGK